MNTKNKPVHLRYSCQGAMEEETYIHPQERMKLLGITYQHATPQSIAEQWWFWNCENVPDKLPDYIELMEMDPMTCIGYGLSKEDAEKIRDYKKKPEYEYRYSKRDVTYPSPIWDVVRYSEFPDVSGGPIIAYFYDEPEAKEYCEFKNNQLKSQSNGEI